MSVGLILNAPPRHRRQLIEKMAKGIAGAFEHTLEARKLTSFANLDPSMENGDAALILKRTLAVWELEDLVKLPEGEDGKRLLARLGAICVVLIKAAHLVSGLHDMMNRLQPQLEENLRKACAVPNGEPLMLPSLLSESSTEMVMDYVLKAATEVLTKPDEELWQLQVIGFDANDSHISDSEEEVDEGGDIDDSDDDDDDDDNDDEDDEEELDSDEDSDSVDDSEGAKRQRLIE